MMNARGAVAGLVLAILLALPASARAGEFFASVGTGELNGLYYPVGRAICQLVNRALPTTSVRCSAETTPGSVYNVAQIQSGELEFAIVQSDVAAAAYNGKGGWDGRPLRQLRTVFKMYPEVVTIIARAASGIQSLSDLAGKRLNVGTQGSGTRATWDIIEGGTGWTGSDRVRASALRTEATTRALCQGEIDANLLIVGYSSPLVETQLTSCATNLVAVTGPAIDQFLNITPYYSRVVISEEVYGLRGDVPSVGGRAVLVTAQTIDARVVAAFAQSVLSQLDDFRALHPALARLTADEMTAGSLPAPLHSAAAEVYKELGLAK